MGGGEGVVLSRGRGGAVKGVGWCCQGDGVVLSRGWWCCPVVCSAGGWCFLGGGAVRGVGAVKGWWCCPGGWCCPVVCGAGGGAF